MRTLNQLTASAVRRLAESSLADRLKIKAQEEKVAKEQEKLEEYKSSVEDINALIVKKTGYSFDDLFTIQVVEKEGKDGKITRANKIFWRYPETYTPPQTTVEEEEGETPSESQNDNESEEYL